MTMSTDEILRARVGVYGGRVWHVLADGYRRGRTGLRIEQTMCGKDADDHNRPMLTAPICKRCFAAAVRPGGTP